MRQLGTVRPRTPVGGSEAGLSSLRTTVGKLEDDEGRHRGNLGSLSSRMASCHQRNRYEAERYLRKSFGASGYQFLKTLGAGRHGVMKLAQRRTASDNGFAVTLGEEPSSSSGSLVAVRVIQRFSVDPKGGHLKVNSLLSERESYLTLLRHASAMRELDHPNIQRVHEIFEDSQHIYLVTQLCSGGDVLAREDGAMPEVRAAWCVAQLCSAMAHAHERGVVHQDLRPPNVLYATQEQDSRLVVTDWDCCEYVSTPPEGSRRNLIITDFAAPELRCEMRSDRADMWSIGVMAFVLVANRLPFLAGAPPKDFAWAEEGAEFTAEFRDFIARLLRLNPEERPSARIALAHPWLLSAWVTSRPPGVALKPRVRAGRFQEPAALRRTAACLTSEHLAGQRLLDFEEALRQLDTNGDGRIPLEDLTQGLHRALSAVPDEECSELDCDLRGLLDDSARIKVLLGMMEKDAEGKISYREFLAAIADACMENCVELCWEAFRTFDLNDSGFITKDKVWHVLHHASIGKIVDQGRIPGRGPVTRADLQRTFDVLGGIKPRPLDDTFEVNDPRAKEKVSFDTLLQAVIAR